MDNSTYWVHDFNKAHYENMFNGSGESFADFYTKQSAGQYTAINTVTDWVKVPGNASTYGDNAVEDLGGSWAFIQRLGQRLVRRPDGGGQDRRRDQDLPRRSSTSGTATTSTATATSTSPTATSTTSRPSTPVGARTPAAAPARTPSGRTAGTSTRPTTASPARRNGQNLLGGAQIGDTGVWIGDYTVEPENGGLGVFAHEFGHDLGLPDYYDTDGGENGTAFWTLMSSGSWLNQGGDAIGTTPGLMGPEEKLFLGWLDYSDVDAGSPATYASLAPSQDDATRATRPSRSTCPTHRAPTTTSPRPRARTPGGRAAATT